MARIAMGVGLSLVGAAVGAALGVGLFVFLLKQSLYALIIPGAALGLGAQLASPDRSNGRGVLLGVAGLILGVIVEWTYFPFVADESLSYFLQHIPQLKSWTLLMIVAGGAFAYWWGREASPWLPRSMRAVDPLQVQRGVERDQA